MKRKKLYSILAFSMAVTLVAGVPVSAATSITTDDFGSDVVVDTEQGEKNPEVEQDVVLGKDGAGNVTAVIIPESGDASSVIEDKIDSATTTGTINGTETVNDPDVLPDNVVLDEAEKEIYAKDAKEKFEAIKADKVMISLPGKKVTIKTVTPEVQSVAEKAAEKMAEKLGLKLAADGLMASADIHVPLNDGESVKVTIPMADGALDTENFDYFVLHYNESTGAWETLQAQVTEDGIVIATFNSFSPVFVVKTDKAAKAPVDDGTSNGGQSDSNGSNGSDSSNDSGSSSSSSTSTTDNSQKAAPAPVVNEPVNPAVSPKTGE